MTDKMKILEYLKEHRYITHKEAESLFHCTRLGARICDLRKDGHVIVTNKVPNLSKPGTHAMYEYKNPPPIVAEPAAEENETMR